MTASSPLKTQAIRLIREVLGDTTARMYTDYYQDKPDELVRTSLTELLIEVLGETKAREKIAAPAADQKA